MSSMLRLQIWNIIGCLLWFGLGCSPSVKENRDLQPTATSSDRQPQLISVPDIDPTTIGNMRIAIVSKHKTSNLLLVNQGNTAYLKAKEAGKPRHEVALSELEYQSPYLSHQDRTSVVILEDEAMAKLVAFLDQKQFYEQAAVCTAEEIAKPDWPARDAIWVDNNGRLYLLLRDESLLDESRRSNVALYRTLKYNILQAQHVGYRPLQIHNNVDPASLFQQQN